jgi:hypothetical protein
MLRRSGQEPLLQLAKTCQRFYELDVAEGLRLDVTCWPKNKKKCFSEFREVRVTQKFELSDFFQF